jgi:hypothetical protein
LKGLVDVANSYSTIVVGGEDNDGARYIGLPEIPESAYIKESEEDESEGNEEELEDLHHEEPVVAHHQHHEVNRGHQEQQNYHHEEPAVAHHQHHEVNRGHQQQNVSHQPEFDYYQHAVNYLEYDDGVDGFNFIDNAVYNDGVQYIDDDEEDDVKDQKEEQVSYMVDDD